ncbi:MULTISPECIES: DUF1365 domain-containing protein [unclassified Iodidimonas]|jgi:DUF1365 family protein|uniref:DUF1365 domain-containing protein n=1 Tax=unclassified Iodidimonas TaxID=2626145 RepID=UPI002482C5F7|nr:MULTISPECIES: DUF1365 domain-containing protein [unclassified Iodidimonas]
MQSALYTGHVMHRRLSPVRHRFSYAVFSLFLDLDELPALAARLRLFSHNRFNLFSFHDKDHGEVPLEKGEGAGAKDEGAGGAGLKAWAQQCLAAKGLEADRIGLLCFPRLFGYVFNPLAVYFCYDRAGALVALIHQVSNTFGERHCYVLPVDDPQQRASLVQQACDKRFYVSPFLAISGRYRFRIHPPDDRLMIAIDHSNATEHLLAVQNGRREKLCDAVLAKRLVTHPLMTLKVITAIHWEALRLWRKGAPVYRHEGGMK